MPEVSPASGPGRCPVSRGPGIRHRQFARLGGQGHGAAVGESGRGRPPYQYRVGQSCRFALSSFQRAASSNARDFPQGNAPWILGGAAATALPIRAGQSCCFALTSSHRHLQKGLQTRSCGARTSVALSRPTGNLLLPKSFHNNPFVGFENQTTPFLTSMITC
jgi:hypothetical protein